YSILDVKYYLLYLNTIKNEMQNKRELFFHKEGRRATSEKRRAKSEEQRAKSEERRAKSEERSANFISYWK
ncbi:MAG: hypothetical protein WD512_15355, partial [Candidatus Paceibacterota bacterium]